MGSLAMSGSAFTRSAIFLALLLAAPFALGNAYYVSILILGCFNAMAAVGLNLLIGYAGQISLGHAAFYGISAYVTAILSASHGWPMEASIPTAVAVSAACAWLIGKPSLKLTGHYLAMATLGFGVIVSIVFNEAVETTGGPSGFVGIPRLELLGFAFNKDITYYRGMAVVLAAMVLVALNLIDSRQGRALRAIHGSPRAAECLGVDIAAAKRFVFVISAAMAAVAGALYAHYLEFVAPSSFGFLYSVQLIVMVVLGGMGSVWGSVAGAFFLTALPELLRAFEDVEIVLYGLILILTMMFLPGGIAGGLSALAARLRRARAGAGEGTHAR